MSKVLIIGPRFHYFNACIERAFCTLGFETHVLEYDNPVHPYNWKNKVLYKWSKDKLGMKRRSRILWQSEADKVFTEFSPDLIFIMNGDMLLPTTIKSWRLRGAKVALWFFDSMTKIPLCEDNITAADVVFCYEQTDIPIILERYDVEAHFLPQAVDNTLYHRIAGAKKTLDIVFAGDLFHSQKRKDVVRAVVAHYPDLRIKVWGEYKPWFKNPWKWLTREHREIYQNRNASAGQLNADYNASRIVLNVHNEQQKDGANPKVYEIAASGSYQICDANPYIESLFPNGEIGLYHNVDDLFACIDEALATSKSNQSAMAEKIVIENHVFESRIRQVLSIIYNNPI